MAEHGRGGFHAWSYVVRAQQSAPYSALDGHSDMCVLQGARSRCTSVQGIHYESTQVDSYMYNDSVLYRGTVYGSTGTIGNRFAS